MALPEDPRSEATAHRRFAESLVRRQSLAILRAWGFPEDTARVTADVLTQTDLRGIDSHGISMFINYERLFSAGALNTAAKPVVVRENPCTALIDGQRGLGHPTGVTAMELAIEKAATTGIGVVSVFNSHHFGAAGHYPAIAAERGYVALAMTSARTSAVVPTGGAEPRLSTNPIAFAAPARTHDPFLLDMSTSTVAVNKIKVYDLNDKPLPQGWFVDRDGQPVTDPATALRSAWEGHDGGLTPLGGTKEAGGHKGYGLSLMVQILSGALSGGSFSATRPAGAPDNIGHFFLALDPEVFRPGGGFLDEVDQIIEAMHATSPEHAGTSVMVAGEPESHTLTVRQRTGIPLPDTLLVKLRDICERAGAPFVLDDGGEPHRERP